MNQLTLDGYISWQNTGAPAEAVNFAENLNYVVVETFEITPDSTATIAFNQALQNSNTLSVVTAVYMEVYSGSVTISSTSGSPGLTIAGQLAHTFGSGGEGAGPTRPLIGRFFYTFPTDDEYSFPNSGSQSLVAAPSNGSSAKIWVFIR